MVIDPVCVRRLYAGREDKAGCPDLPTGAVRTCGCGCASVTIAVCRFCRWVVMQTIVVCVAKIGLVGHGIS
jgi:hypothetical protein